MFPCTKTILETIDRRNSLFDDDLEEHGADLEQRVRQKSFLVIGGAGTIGQAVAKQIFLRKPARLHVIDISENNLVELVRDLRSSAGYIDGDFRTLALDCGSPIFDAFLKTQEPYDYVFNLSALKHVRSEKDPFTLMRMIQVNVLNTVKLAEWAASCGTRKFFGVSTDKAVNPANAMGATKAVMEACMMKASERVPVSTARFANVAFSDGSLLHGFTERIRKRQPIAAPRDVRRYFVTPDESGTLCLMSSLLGNNREVFFPKARADFRLIGFQQIAERYLETIGFSAHPCASEEEARGRVAELVRVNRWPCFFFDTDTTGEKPFEEFFAEGEVLDLERFDSIGVIRKPRPLSDATVETFLGGMHRLLADASFSRRDLLSLLDEAVPGFRHKETERFLDGRM